jgi:hypothetical protein
VESACVLVSIDGYNDELGIRGSVHLAPPRVDIPRTLSPSSSLTISPYQK